MTASALCFIGKTGGRIACHDNRGGGSVSRGGNFLVPLWLRAGVVLDTRGVSSPWIASGGLGAAAAAGDQLAQVGEALLRLPLGCGVEAP